MDRNQQLVIEHVLLEEGDALRNERGHLTKWGLTTRQLLEYKGTAFDQEEYLTLSREMARDIFSELWLRQRFDRLPTGLDLFVFDSSVVCGFDVTRGWVNALTNYTAVDQGDLSAIDFSQYDIPALIRGVAVFRRRRLKLLPKWQQNREKWTNRTNRALAKSVKLLTGGRESYEEITDSSGKPIALLLKRNGTS